jgi:hypothetical protein
MKTFIRDVLRQSCSVFCRNFCIRDLRMNHINLRICDLRNGTPKNFADLRLRNEPKNFRICNLRTFKKKFVCPPLLIADLIINCEQKVNVKYQKHIKTSVLCLGTVKYAGKPFRFDFKNQSWTWQSNGQHTLACRKNTDYPMV